MQKRYLGELKLNYKVITIYITNRCQLSCNNCFALKHLNLPIQDIDYYMLKSKISRDKIEDFETIMLSGGEAPLHPHFNSICQLFKRSIVVCTNGINTFSAPSNVSMQSSNKDCNYEQHLPLHLDGRDIFTNCFRLEQCGIAMGVNGKYYCCACASFIDQYKDLNLGVNNISELSEYNQREICKYCM